MRQRDGGMADTLEERDHTIRLFEAYGGLLTNRQQDLMRLYYFDDLSLGEIADRLRITRQAVYDSLQRSLEELGRLEAHLRLVRDASGGRSATLVRRLRAIAERLLALADRLDLASRRESGPLRTIAGDLRALGDQASEEAR